MNLNPSDGVALFTDGSAHNSGDKSGGWAWVALDAYEGIHTASGAAANTTNNRMELQAAIEGLDALHNTFGPCEVLIYSDSEYMVLGVNENRQRKTNLQEWSALDSAIASHIEVRFEHVYGHQGNIYNEMADQLAGKARKESIANDQ